MRLAKKIKQRSNLRYYKEFSSDRNDGFCSPCIRTSEQSILIVADIVGRVLLIDCSLIFGIGGAVAVNEVCVFRE